jgi:hypothetical protein
MVNVTIQNGKVLMRDDLVGTDTNCCCHVCYEKVFSFYNAAWTNSGWWEPYQADVVPGDQPDGTYEVIGDEGVIFGCVGENVIQDSIKVAGSVCFNSSEPDRISGAAIAQQQWYWRFRIVNDCSDCVSTDVVTGPGTCQTGTQALACYLFTGVICNDPKANECLNAAGINLC